MSKSAKNKAAINNAFSLIGNTGSKDAKELSEKSNSVLPTAKTRRALDVLTQNTPQSIQEINLKPLLQDLFNWDNKNHVNKPLIRAFSEAINYPGKYPQAIELTGYLAAMAPLLEADQIARMYSLVHEIDTAFAPQKYTIQLSERLKKVLGGFSSERRERLATSLWKESHDGRWWNLTAGIGMADFEQQNIEIEPKTAEEIFDNIQASFVGTTRNRDLHQLNDTVEWNKTYQETFSHIEMSRDIALLAEEYSDNLASGKFVHPDIAVYLSALPWLAPSQRPESPVSGLLKYLIAVVDALDTEDRKKVKKPKKFSDLFPSIYLQAGASNDYPLSSAIRSLDGKTIAKNNKIQTIKNKISLAENAKFMGNCTLSYDNRMKNGESALLFVNDGTTQHNIAIKMNKDGSWNVGEINARYNRGSEVNPDVRAEIKHVIEQLPKENSAYLQYVKEMKSKDSNKSHTFSYSVF